MVARPKASPWGGLALPLGELARRSAVTERVFMVLQTLSEPPVRRPTSPKGRGKTAHIYLINSLSISLQP